MTYQDLASRTATHDYEAITPRITNQAVLHELYRVYMDLIDLSARADKLKKYVYYGAGRPPESDERLEASLGYHLVSVLEQPALINLLHGMLGLLTETGELWDAFEYMMTRHWPDVDSVLEELGDIAWYQALIANTFRITLEEVQSRNIAKLKQRYPQGFTAQNAVERDTEAEREAVNG